MYPRMKVVMLTTFDGDEYIEVALKFGAIGCLLKNIPPEEFIGAVRAANGGATQMAPEVLEKTLARQSTEGEKEPAAFRESLTRRGKEILELIRNAYRNREVAKHLGVSQQTVKDCVHNLYEKLGVSDRFRLIKALHTDSR